MMQEAKTDIWLTSSCRLRVNSCRRHMTKFETSCNRRSSRSLVSTMPLNKVYIQYTLRINILVYMHIWKSDVLYTQGLFRVRMYVEIWRMSMSRSDVKTCTCAEWEDRGTRQAGRSAHARYKFQRPCGRLRLRHAWWFFRLPGEGAFRGRD